LFKIRSAKVEEGRNEAEIFSRIILLFDSNNFRGKELKE